MITADEAVATVALLVPGFVAVKVFASFGLRTRRSDLELTIWSLLMSALLRALIAPLGIADKTVDVVVSVAVGAATGAVLAGGWLLVVRAWPRLARRLSRRAWDAMYLQAGWMQVWLDSGQVVFGWPHDAGETAETDEPDVLIGDPDWVNPETQERTRMTNVDFVYVPERSVRLIQYFRQRDPKREPWAPVAPVDPPARHDDRAARRLAVSPGGPLAAGDPAADRGVGVDDPGQHPLHELSPRPRG